MKKFINGKMINLAEPRLGSKVIFKTDDFFASANRIISPNPPIFKEGVFCVNLECRLLEGGSRLRIPKPPMF